MWPPLTWLERSKSSYVQGCCSAEEAATSMVQGEDGVFWCRPPNFWLPSSTMAFFTPPQRPDMWRAGMIVRDPPTRDGSAPLEWPHGWLTRTATAWSCDGLLGARDVQSWRCVFRTFLPFLSLHEAVYSLVFSNKPRRPISTQREGLYSI